jgi:hypothetical protein
MRLSNTEAFKKIGAFTGKNHTNTLFLIHTKQILTHERSSNTPKKNNKN